MKIVCDACQAKYSISDDKVQGKVFKIRCKKCSNIIVVRGGAAAEPAPAPTVEKDTRVYDYGYDGGDRAPAGDEAVWHVVINQDQVGPMTAAEVQQKFSAGEIDAETYIWREGFADWMPMMQVDQFAGFVASGSRTAAVGGGGGGGAMSNMFSGTGLGTDEAGTVRSDPGDLFAAAAASSRRDDDGGDLFGKPASSGRNNAGEAAAKLRGERNENSVLFSLNNLAQLASDKPAPVTAPPSSSSAGHATGQAGGEGSGLIDIRSMANAYLGGAGAAKPATSSAIGSIDDLPVFGGGGFSEPAVIVPTSARAGQSKLLYALIGSVGLLAVAAVVLVVVMLKGGDDKDKKEQVASNDDKGVKTEPATPAGAGSAAEAPKADGSGSAAQTAEAPKTEPTEPKQEPKTEPKAEPKSEPKSDRKTTPSPRRDPRPSTPAVARTEPKPPKTVEKPPAGNDSSSCDEVSCVLNNYEGACCQKFRKGGAPKSAPSPTQIGERPRSDVPESLDRAMISEGVAKVKAKVAACGDRSSAKGEVKVSVKVSPDGNVSSVTLKNTPDQALGSCVVGAMQRASFKRTASGGSFAYPFRF